MKKLKETDYVVYNKSKDIVMSREGEILIFNDEDTIVSCLDLPQHWIDIITKQLKQKKSK
jgi:hypothetical protein